MKALLGLLLCVGLSTIEAASTHPMFKGWHDICLKETGVAQELLDRASKENILIDDQKFKCFLLCVFANWGVVNPDGTFNADKALATLPAELLAIFKTSIPVCKNITAPDGCETAHRIASCNRDKTKDNFVFFF